MPVSVSYVARETTGNLRRNALMSVAAVVTMSVGLLFAGAAVLWGRGVDRQTARWRGGVELSVFMQPAASQQQLDAVARELDDAPEVKGVRVCDKACAYGEMKEYFKAQPDVIESVTEQDAPPSFRVVPQRPELVDQIGARFDDKPGVLEVVYAKETVKTLIESTDSKRWGAAIVGLLAGASALLVILNTVRMAIFSRRREVAIMKLVGATNWFIRVPFMLEGLVQGVLGAFVAFAVIFTFRNQIMGFVNDPALNNLAKLYATTGETVLTGVILLVAGALMGAASSAIAVRSYLDV